MKRIVEIILILLEITCPVVIGYTCPNPSIDVPDGYEPSRGATSTTIFFKPVTTEMNFHDSHMNCLSDGGRLATFKTEDHLLDMEDIMDNVLSKDAWIGLFHVADYPLTCNNAGCIGQLMWSDGIPFVYMPFYSTYGTYIEANEM